MNSLLELCITFGPAVLGFMGLYVSVRPPEKTWFHWAWFAAFFLIGGATSLASFLEMKSADSEQTSLFTEQKDTNGEIQNLISSIDKLSTGVAQISTTQDYQFLTQQQADALIKILKPFANSAGKVNISCEMGSAKACFLASQWNGILNLSGWKSTGVSSGLFTVPPFGVFITVNDAATPGAGIIQHALLTTGIVAQGQIAPKNPPGEIDILFGAYKSSN